MNELEKKTGVWELEDVEEMESTIQELEENLDFIMLGDYGSIQDIYDDLDYHGLSEAEILQFSLNRYGTCLEIVKRDNGYTAYWGQR